MPIPVDSSVEAEYSDGFILNETENNDHSQYADDRNTFFDILHQLPEQEHGPMVRFSVFWKNNRHDINWKLMPSGARPIRFRHGYLITRGDGSRENGFSGVDFGYQYNDEGGTNRQHVERLR